MNKVLIITYYWPPSGGSAVLRWLKFTKYLRDFGWEPVIYTPENPEPQEIDESLLKDIPDNIEVLKTRIAEPYNVYKKLTGKKKEERLGVAFMDQDKKKGIAGWLFLWIRSNIFIPDPRVFWVRPSVKFLTEYISQNPVNAIITSGPPHSMHLIGYGLKKKLSVKWMADFRDPWTNIDFYNDLLLTKWADRLHRKLEKKIITDADHILTVSPGMTREFEELGANRITTVTNGFDEMPVSNVNFTSEKFTILHLGSMPKTRNPVNLWKALAELVEENPDFGDKIVIRLVGKTDHAVDHAISTHRLTRFVKHDPYIPHDQTPGLLNASAVLLLCINDTPNSRGILTNKFFEYLAAQRPILTTGPKDGDAAVILKESGAGVMFEYNEIIPVKNYLLELFKLYTLGKLNVNSTDIEKFSRKSLTGRLSLILNSLR